MSVVTGGIYSKPRGKTGGIVWGAARTRNGKLATARELVKPSNPNTPAQQTQRSKFKSILDTIRRFGPTVYQVAWNRSVGQLPGFQSMESIYLGQTDNARDITLVNEINLGTLHFPDTHAFASPGVGEVEITYSTELSSNGTDADITTMLLAAKTDANRQLVNGVVVTKAAVRSDGILDASGLISGETYEIYVYFEGVGTAAGIFSLAKIGSELVV